ncbi:hypothetical protein KZA05_04525 [Bacillus amyloliquefaciens]|uniref:hypothetical protein n=1 Tax=Bacillus velezensis TaxID=492670 RepID=UPI001C78861D|nr:hypothetical protein KZA05_04525 [Bacillus amyloliquefaciens]
MASCEDIYKDLNYKCQKILLESFSEDNAGLQSKSHSFLSDLQNWIEIIDNRPEADIIKNAQLEYQYSLLAIVQGQYRQAYMALRLFMEQILAAVYFSSNEFELRLWKQGNRDIFWAEITDDEKGIFSKKFVQAFFPPLVEEQNIFLQMAKNIYRECSEFCHGNYHTQVTLNKSLAFNKETFEDWHAKAECARMIILYAFSVRYFEFLGLQQKQEKVEASIMEYLGHLTSVQSFYDRER